MEKLKKTPKKNPHKRLIARDKGESNRLDTPKKPIKYRMENYNGLICFLCDTDFSKYDYSPDITIYKKGWFRGHEGEVVLKITNIMTPEHTPERVKFIYFPTEIKAVAFAKKTIKAWAWRQ